MAWDPARPWEPPAGTPREVARARRVTQARGGAGREWPASPRSQVQADPELRSRRAPRPAPRSPPHGGIAKGAPGRRAGVWVSGARRRRDLNRARGRCPGRPGTPAAGGVGAGGWGEAVEGRFRAGPWAGRGRSPGSGHRWRSPPCRGARSILGIRGHAGLTSRAAPRPGGRLGILGTVTLGLGPGPNFPKPQLPLSELVLLRVP